MKNSMITVAALLATATTAAMGATIRIDTTSYSSGAGGEFKITPMAGYSGETGGVAALAANTFETFCLESGVAFTPGSTYTSVLSTSATVGGPGGTPDPVDARTAFLYTNFRNGTLTGFNYSAGSRAASAASLQQAIWYIEGESGGVNNGFVSLANTAVAAGGSWFGRGLGNVLAMNLTDGSGHNFQGQLTIVPLPSGAAMGMLGLAGLAGARRRRA